MCEKVANANVGAAEASSPTTRSRFGRGSTDARQHVQLIHPAGDVGNRTGTVESPKHLGGLLRYYLQRSKRQGIATILLRSFLNE